jgi:hypothetical protein
LFCHMFYELVSADICVFPDLYVITDELEKDELWNVCVAYCVINGDFFFYRATEVFPDFGEVIVETLHTTQVRTSEGQLSVSGYIIRLSPREY